MKGCVCTISTENKFVCSVHSRTSWPPAFSKACIKDLDVDERPPPGPSFMTLRARCCVVALSLPPSLSLAWPRIVSNVKLEREGPENISSIGLNCLAVVIDASVLLLLRAGFFCCLHVVQYTASSCCSLSYAAATNTYSRIWCNPYIGYGCTLYTSAVL